jgi:hypothetical protein
VQARLRLATNEHLELVSQDPILERKVSAGTTDINKDAKQHQRRPSTGAGAYQGRARHRAHAPDRLLPPFNMFWARVKELN